MSAIRRPTNSRQHRRGRAVILVFALSVLVASAIGAIWASPVQATTGVAYSQEELKFVWLLNDYRVSNGLKPLLLSDTLALSAERHSSDMAKYDFFDHATRGTDWFWWGASCYQRMAKVGYSYNTCRGENIAAGQPTAKEALDGFVGSSAHKKVMLYPYFKVVGVSQVCDSGSKYGWYWTVDFGGYVDPSAHSTGQFQQTDSHITYLGSWSTRWAASASQGSFYYTSNKGAAAIIRFTGTSVVLLAKKGPVYGKALVSLDDESPRLVDFYSKTDAFKKVAFARTGLDAGAHTLTIVCTGKKNAASGGYVVDVDAVRVLTDAGPGTLNQVPALTRRQENDTAFFSYAGAWSTGKTSLASGGSFRSVNESGGRVKVTFTGTYLSWVTRTTPWYGIAAVSLDGGKYQAVDLYSTNVSWKRLVYSTGLIKPGTHTLVIKWLGTKNSRSAGTAVSVDAADLFLTTK